MLNAAQNRLQRGFTKDTSPACGSLLLTEAIAESIDGGKPLYTAFIDASKAFAVVWHESMLVKLYDVGLSGRRWNFLNNWYRGLKSSVRWENELSPAFQERQGVRQGGIWSPSANKHFINPLLDCISEHKLGLHIGSVYCGVVGVADDLLFMSQSREDLHCQLYLQHSYAKRERYKVSETKTKTMLFNAKKSVRKELHF